MISGSLVRIVVGNQELEGELTLPSGATGLVIFAHGSGSSHRSPRNQFVAGQLQAVGLGTLLVDLLTEKEDSDYQTRFNIDLLAERLVAITAWVVQNELTRHMALGYFGASTGAAAAMVAAVQTKDTIKAIVSRGGRIDMANDIAETVQAPTLLIVGENDPEIRVANEEILAKLVCEKALVVVPHATHLFEEPGALEQVAHHAVRWFEEYLKV